MAKRSNIGRVSKQNVEGDFVEVKEKIVESFEMEFEEAGESPPETVRLVCTDGAGIYIITGPVTGIEYQFQNHQPLEVNMNDVEHLLAKRRGCCGNVPQPIFVKI